MSAVVRSHRQVTLALLEGIEASDQVAVSERRVLLIPAQESGANTQHTYGQHLVRAVTMTATDSCCFSSLSSSWWFISCTKPEFM